MLDFFDSHRCLTYRPFTGTTTTPHAAQRFRYCSASCERTFRRASTRPPCSASMSGRLMKRCQSSTPMLLFSDRVIRRCLIWRFLIGQQTSRIFSPHTAPCSSRIVCPLSSIFGLISLLGYCNGGLRLWRPRTWSYSARLSRATTGSWCCSPHHTRPVAAIHRLLVLRLPLLLRAPPASSRAVYGVHLCRHPARQWLRLRSHVVCFPRCSSPSSAARHSQVPCRLRLRRPCRLCTTPSLLPPRP